MTEQKYNWKRFWCPRTSNISLADGGYLLDLDPEYGKFLNPDLVPFESIKEVPCLVLLGEPGIGKSTAMELQRSLIDEQVTKAGGVTFWVDLRACSSDVGLKEKLFKNYTFQPWLNGDHQLHLFLDSLDECPLPINTVEAVLDEEFRNCPVERLFLRVVCRTADWPNSLESRLKQLWGKDAVDVYELAPLRRVDVIEAAENSDLNPKAFLEEIDRREAVPLAIKSVTLQFLINTYRRKGEFPRTRAELYRKGCLLLCEEPSETRREAGLVGNLSAEQRLAVAARIAAVSIFANKSSVWGGLDRGNVPDGDVTVKEFVGGSESSSGRQFEVGEAAVRETLGTGLFSSRGPNRLGWAHQTYAEFLAAWYLVQHKAPLTQIMSLIVHPGASEGKIVSQLRETAAWLAVMAPGVFSEVMKADPEVLLQSDVATTSAEERELLVGALLKLYDEEKLLDLDRNLHRRYRKLAHPGLAGQLRPYIRDETKGVIVRRVAVDIAEACELRELQEDLVEIALDPSQQLPVQVNAAYAVCRIGDGPTKAKLKPLAVGDAGDDPKDRLKGCALRALWPDHITAEELFASLTPPKREDFIGAYDTFLSNEVARHIKPFDLPVALEWVEKHLSERGMLSPFEGLADEIILRAWNSLDSPGVLDAFARTALLRTKDYYEIIKDPLKSEELKRMVGNDDRRRRRFLETAVPMLHDPQNDSFRLVYRVPFALSKDLAWMIERLQESKTENDQRSWAHLIERVFDPRDSAHLDAVFYASQASPILAEKFAWFLKPVELGSPEAEQMRKDYLETEERQKRRQKRRLLEPPPQERISLLLDKCESGDTATWWHLNREMTLDSDNTHYGKELEPDLTALPGWKAADSTTRKRVVEAAKRYVREQDPETPKWLGKNTLHCPTFAGYRALLLLLQEEPHFLSELPADTWQKWAPIIIAYPVLGGFEDESPHLTLVEMAYRHAPEEIIKTLLLMIDKENAEGDYIFVTRMVQKCWDERLAKALLAKVKDEELKPKCMGCLLGDLMAHNIDEGRAFAESLISVPAPSDEKERSRAVAAAGLLMIHTEDAGWPVVWPAIQGDAGFGREVISAVAQDHDRHAATVGQKLTEGQLADLYIWLVRQFPYAEDPVHKEAYRVGPRESVADWRNAILNHLKNRGTYQACEEIMRAARELPEINWLKYSVLTAEEITLRQAWTPLRPRDILRIAANQQDRLVQNGDQLLGVLMESLNRLEAKLQGETPAAVDLWNECKADKKTVYRPKDEDRLSDYVKRHLDEDLRQRGIIFNREVEIRRGAGPGTGERTDIHVDTVVRGPNGEVYDRISAIIEVKGCWNRELEEAMKAQLVDRYLKDNRCQYGLYLIGWFACVQWDDKDYRKSLAPRLSRAEAKAEFEAQAKEFSKQGLRISAFILNTALR